jgi:hypothetical protein
LDQLSVIGIVRWAAATALASALVVIVLAHFQWFTRVWTFGSVSVERDPNPPASVIVAVLLVVVLGSVWLLLRRQRFVAIVVAVVAGGCALIALVGLFQMVFDGAIERTPREARHEFPAQFADVRQAALDDPRADPAWSDGVGPVLTKVRSHPDPVAWLALTAAVVMGAAALMVVAYQPALPERTWLFTGSHSSHDRTLQSEHSERGDARGHGDRHRDRDVAP